MRILKQRLTGRQKVVTFLHDRIGIMHVIPTAQLFCYLAKTQLGIQASMSAFFDLQAAKVGRHCGDFIFPERHLISSHISTFLNTLQPMAYA